MAISHTNIPLPTNVSDIGPTLKPDEREKAECMIIFENPGVHSPKTQCVNNIAKEDIQLLLVVQRTMSVSKLAVYSVWCVLGSLRSVYQWNPSFFFP